MSSLILIVGCGKPGPAPLESGAQIVEPSPIVTYMPIEVPPLKEEHESKETGCHKHACPRIKRKEALRLMLLLDAAYRDPHVGNRAKALIYESMKEIHDATS
jgi:hypothetical protein